MSLGQSAKPGGRGEEVRSRGRASGEGEREGGDEFDPKLCIGSLVSGPINPSRRGSARARR